MKMFANHHVQYTPSNESLDGSFSICPSSSSSFSSDASSSSWESEMVMMTPSSTPRRGSPSSVKLERTPSQISFTSTPTSSPNRYTSQTAFYPMTSMPHEMMSFTDPNFLYQDDGILQPGGDNLVDYIHFNSYQNSNTSLNDGMNHSLHTELVCDIFQANQGMSMEPPALDLDLYSPESGMSSSPTSEDFVVPSQTTFINAFDLQSPMAPVKSLHFDIAYDSPLSEFDNGFSMDEDSMHGSDTTTMSYCIPSNPNYPEPKSSSTAPSHSSSLRHSIFRPPPSTAALQQIQDINIKPEELSRTRSYRDFKREEVYRDIRDSSCSSASKIKRLKRESIYAGNIKIQPSARKECPYEGCTGKFRRKEHLKRHEKTHQIDADVFPCIFCTKIFRGRYDNLRSHVRLHTLPDGAKKSRRTAYHPDALAEYQRMDRKRKGGSSSEHDEAVKQEVEGGKMLRSRISGY